MSKKQAELSVTIANCGHKMTVIQRMTLYEMKEALLCYGSSILDLPRKALPFLLHVSVLEKTRSISKYLLTPKSFTLYSLKVKTQIIVLINVLARF